MGHNPLSLFTYYRHNKRKVIPVVAIIALAVLAISATGALSESLFAEDRRQFNIYDHYSIVGSMQSGGITDAVLQPIRSSPAADGILTMDSRSTRTQGIFGSQGRPIYFISHAEHPTFAARLHWDLVEGRWPGLGTNEVVVSQNILRNRGLRVGGHIGTQTYPADYITGDWVIVGALTPTPAE